MLAPCQVNLDCGDDLEYQAFKYYIITPQRVETAIAMMQLCVRFPPKDWKEFNEQQGNTVYSQYSGYGRDNNDYWHMDLNTILSLEALNQERRKDWDTKGGLSSDQDTMQEVTSDDDAVFTKMDNNTMSYLNIIHS